MREIGLLEIFFEKSSKTIKKRLTKYCLVGIIVYAVGRKSSRHIHIEA